MNSTPAPTKSQVAGRLDITVVNDLVELERLAGIVSDFVAANGIAEDVAFHLNLCFDELITNTILYGYGDSGPHEIRIRLKIENALVRAEIEDDARAFNPFQDAPPPDLDSPLEERQIGGLGVFFVQRMTEACDYARVNDRNITTLICGRNELKES